jgi:hypothetical protein
MANESLLSEVLDVAVPSVTNGSRFDPKVVHGNDTEGAEDRQRAGLRPAKAVLISTDRHGLPGVADRQVEPLSEYVPWIPRPGGPGVGVATASASARRPFSGVRPAPVVEN